MVIYFPFFIIPKSVHVGVDEDDDEGKEEVKEKPHIHHLHIGGLWQVVAYVDKHGRQHEHGGQVHGDNGLKILKVKVNYLILTHLKEKGLEKVR